jgi:hypothetical protein
MTTKKGPGAYPIPFHKGGLCHFPGWPQEPTEWRDNYTFVAELVFQGFRRGRSGRGSSASWPIFPGSMSLPGGRCHSQPNRSRCCASCSATPGSRSR